MDKLVAALGGMTKRVVRKRVSSALRAGAKVVQASAAANAPVKSGQLKRSIKVRSSRTRRPGEVGIVVITGAGDYKGDEFYGAFQEYGWEQGDRSDDNRHAQVLRRRAKQIGKEIEKKFPIPAHRLSDPRFMAGRLDHLFRMAMREFGTDKPAGPRRYIAGKHYMLVGFEVAKDQAAQTILTQLAAGIEEEAKA